MTDRYDDAAPAASTAGADGGHAVDGFAETYGPRRTGGAAPTERAGDAAHPDHDVEHRGSAEEPDDETAPHAASVDDETPHDRLSARAHVNTAAPAPHLPGPHAGPGSEAPQYGVGPFSVREVSLLGIWAVAFLVSFFPDNNVVGEARVLVGGSNVWLSGLWWIPTVALPTVAVGLLVLRRLSPQGIRRVGSLGIDQFASVAFSIAAFVWVAWVWDTVVVAIQAEGWVRSWVIWVEAVLLLAGVVLTVLAPFIPPFEQDFQGRDEAPAHRNARPIRAVVPRPRVPRAPRPVRTPAAVADDRPADGAHVPEAPGSRTGSTEPAHAPEPAPATTVMPTHSDDETDVIAAWDADDVDSGAHAAPQAFWALAPVERDIVDDYGVPIFRIGPTAWALVVEDRGETFVVRHDDGRIGYLHDVSGVTRG